MKRTHALIASLLLGVSVIAGAFAVTNTVGLGASAKRPPVSPQAIAQRTARLDRYEASLRAALGKKPPKLPSVPQNETGSAAAASARRVVYVRPAPVVVTRHLSTDESEHESGSDEAGGGDD
jgi:hypothetical protein